MIWEKGESCTGEREIYRGFARGAVGTGTTSVMVHLSIFHWGGLRVVREVISLAFTAVSKASARIHRRDQINY